MENTIAKDLASVLDENYELMEDLLSFYIGAQRQLVEEYRINNLSWKEKLKCMKTEGTIKSVIRVCVDFIGFNLKWRLDKKACQKQINDLFIMIEQCFKQIGEAEKMNKKLSDLGLAIHKSRAIQLFI